jgi:hypothetical protein
LLPRAAPDQRCSGVAVSSSPSADLLSQRRSSAHRRQPLRDPGCPRDNHSGCQDCAIRAEPGRYG